ncbi:Endonuclease/exonuclease/phosphatase [Pholiota molesta]|nr:Endonuclease/exonuclease/phosphatase [Pholiota molesta]
MYFITIVHTNSDNIRKSRRAQNRRILAVVSHKDDWDLTEEGSLFLDIQRVFPIYGQFSVVMSQMRRGAVDVRPNMSSKSVLEQPALGIRNDISLSTFFTYDVQNVDANAVINLATSTTHFSWLKPYLEKHTTVAALTSLPQDLRQINRPLLERLSPTSAGLTGDDYVDAQTIKDDWVRRKARDMSRIGRRKLKLRVGTFNVNGKMPSQDLSAWVQGDGSDARAPPVKNISPLSLGEVVRNPFTWSKHVRFNDASLLSIRIASRRMDSIRVDLTNPEIQIYRIGFQELDLSTEALIYSTGTLREDAWCLALISKQLVGMLLVIFVKKELQSCFGNITTSAAGAGILGIMGNKGGTAVRLTFTPPSPSTEEQSQLHSPGSTTLTFVNAHLAAFDEMVDRRNSDFQDLSKRLSFDGLVFPSSNNLGSEAEGGDDHAAADTSTLTVELPPRLSIYETDSLFWMGDLNYRMDIPDATLRGILHDDEWDNGPKVEALIRFDQLKKSIQDKKAFFGLMKGY